MSITKVNYAQIPEFNMRNPEITKVNDTQIHQCTNIDKAYQWKSQKIGETHILEIYTRNPEITKKGGKKAYHKREHKAHQHVYHKRNANSMVANHHKLSRAPQTARRPWVATPPN